MVCARCAAQRSWVRNSIHGPRNWCFCFHFSSQPCLILFPFFIERPSSSGLLPNFIASASWRNSPIIPHDLQSAPVGFTLHVFPFSLRECLLIVPVFNFQLAPTWTLLLFSGGSRLRSYGSSFSSLAFISSIFHFGEAALSIQFTHRQPCEMP